MRNFILLFFVIIPFVVAGQTSSRPENAPRKEKHRNVTDEIGRKQGLWKSYSETGILVWEIEYVDNIRHGVSKRYYSSGRIMRETTYQYGIKDGDYKRYYVNGNVRQEGSYNGNKRSGRWTSYYSSGNIQNEGEYINNYKEGVWKYYNQKGELTNMITFVHGRDQREIDLEAKKAAQKKADAEKKNKKLINRPSPAVKPPATGGSDSLRL